MGFQGWKGDFIGFFRGLEVDNSKRYFEAHRKQYEQEVRKPFEELIAELEPVLGPAKLFRINRDVRFSRDKSPYKTNIAAVVGRMYVHLDARVMHLATGARMPETAWLARYREAIAGPAGEEFATIVQILRDVGYNVGGNPLRAGPRGYPSDHPRLEMLRWREVGAGKTYPVGRWIATPAVKDRVLEAWADMRPLSDWLVENVHQG
jgi:uncharacterized protein (TIGR02453 family)